MAAKPGHLNYGPIVLPVEAMPVSTMAVTAISNSAISQAVPAGATGCILTSDVDFSYRTDAGTPTASAGIKVAADVPHRAIMPDSTGKIISIRSKAVSGTLCLQFIKPRS